MCEDRYTYTVDLTFRPEHASVENLTIVADALFANARRGDIPRVKVEGEKVSLSVESMVFDGNEFEYVILRFLYMFEDVVYYASGVGLRYYFRIHDCVLEDCGTIQEPDELWKRSWLMEGPYAYNSQ